MWLNKILMIDPRPLLREGLKSVLRERDNAIVFSGAGSESEFINITRHCQTYDLIIAHETFLLTANHGMITSYLYKTDNPIVVICDEVSEKLDIKLKFLSVSGVIRNSEPIEEVVSKIFDFLIRRCRSETFSSQAYHESENSKAAGDLVKQVPISNTFFTKDKLEYLTDRQRDVLGYLKVGLMNKEIAYEMGIRESTVKRHVSDIFKKLSVQNRTQLAVGLTY